MLRDGRCALPGSLCALVCPLDGGDFGGVVKHELEARLEDAQLTGDRRVNWLRGQARSWAQPAPLPAPIGRFLAGEGYLEEATLVAESEPQRLRAYQELAVRMAAYERIDGPRAGDARACGGACASPASSRRSRRGGARWSRCVGPLKNGESSGRRWPAAPTSSGSKRGGSGHLRGDSQASTHYEQLLQQSGATEPVSEPTRSTTRSDKTFQSRGMWRFPFHMGFSVKPGAP